MPIIFIFIFKNFLFLFPPPPFACPVYQQWHPKEGPQREGSRMHRCLETLLPSLASMGEI